LLLDKGTRISAETDNGWTAFYIAAAYGKEIVVKLLLDRGASISAKDDTG
jgi:ankyrin repeat protein